MSGCYHCGLPVPAGASYTVLVGGQQRQMCCPGCQAVATAIVDGGLGRFYQYRSSNAQKPESEQARAYEGYDLPEVQKDIVETTPAGRLTIRLVIGGITCAACAWLIEKHLSKQPGVESVRVNVTQHQCRVEWDPEQIRLSRIFYELAAIGYEARPLHDSQVAELRQQENKRFLQRLGLAGLGMMQTGMVATGLYFGAFQGMDADWKNLLRWVGLFFATPVVLFSAQPFFIAAWRSLKVRSLTMDVSVSLAIGLAYSASLWATLTQSGEVYFDSVVMFTFFLSLGRYLEMNVRHRNAASVENMGQLLPLVALRVEPEGDRAVPVRMLAKGDLVRIGAGDIIPCDGEVEEGRSAVIEALLTGEPQPVAKRKGDVVSAGTCNTEHPLLVRVQAVGVETRLSAILNLTEEAGSQRPRIATVADSIAGYFVAAVLLISVATALYWWQQAPAEALWITLSVLVVTCPCALSLATPSALTVAAGELQRSGFLINRSHVLETLAVADHVVFDKTGTLTSGIMSVAGVMPLADIGCEKVLALSAALELGSNHPIARAFPVEDSEERATGLQQYIGEGISGIINGTHTAIGKAEFVAQLFDQPLPPSPPVEPGQILLLLADETGLLAWIYLQDQVRPETAAVIERMARKGLKLLLCSGDRSASVEAIARDLSIPSCKGDMTPEQKLETVRQLQKEGGRVVMVGDGINDVPVLSGADVSVAMGGAADFAQIHADSVLLSGNLETLVVAIETARKARHIIWQNLGWALLYNLFALPLAVAGMVPPWAAAIGMSASSLLVVTNALRLGRAPSEAVDKEEYVKALN